MKRVLPFVLLITALEIFSIVWSCTWLFKYRYVNVSDVTVLDNHSDSEGYYHVTFSQNNKTYSAIMSPGTYRIIFQKQHQIKYILADSYIGLGILCIIYTLGLGIYIIIRTGDLFASYYSYRDIGDRFSEYSSILPDSYSELYNKIDAYDLTPILQIWYKFWGYETSTSNIDSSNNC